MGEVFGFIVVIVVVGGPLIWQILGDQRDLETSRDNGKR